MVKKNPSIHYIMHTISHHGENCGKLITYILVYICQLLSYNYFVPSTSYSSSIKELALSELVISLSATSMNVRLSSE